MPIDFETLWDDSLDSRDITTTGNVVGLMGKATEALREKTDGNVRGRFIKVKKLAGAEAALLELSKASSKLLDNDGLADANDLYASKRYAYDIISGTYRFRLFSVVLEPVYPLDLVFDEGVLKEMREASLTPYSGPNASGAIRVDNDDDLMAVFSNAIATRKVKYLLQKLCDVGTEPGK